MSTASRTSPPGLTGRRNAVIAAFALGGITVSAWGPRLPALTRELHADTAAIGVVLAFLTVGSITGLGASTPVSTRLGNRRGIAGSLAVIAVGMLVIALGAALGAIVVVGVGFLAIGSGIGLLDVLMNVEGAAVEADAGRTLLPLMHAAWSVGAVLGSGIGAGCALLGIPPSLQFAGEAILIGATGLVASRFIPRGVRAEDAAAGADRPPLGARLRSWLRGWGDRRLLLVGVVMLGVELGEGTANNWLTLSSERDHGVSATTAALFFTVFAASEALFRIFGGPVVDRLGRVATVRLTAALGVVGFLLFILGPDPWFAIAGVVLWAVGISMGFPLGMSAAAEGGAGAAARVSVVASIGYLANLAGPPVIGILASGVGLLGSFVVPTVLLAAAFLCAGALRAPRASDR